MLKLVAHLVTTTRLESSVVLLGPHSTAQHTFHPNMSYQTRATRSKQEQGLLFILNYPKIYFSIRW